LPLLTLKSYEIAKKDPDHFSDFNCRDAVYRDGLISSAVHIERSQTINAPAGKIYTVSRQHEKRS
jgi:hypothetical protein